MEKYQEYKDSGVQWLGKIPGHWGKTHIGRLFEIKAGGDAKPELYSDIKDQGHPYPVYANTKIFCCCKGRKCCNSVQQNSEIF